MSWTPRGAWERGETKGKNHVKAGYFYQEGMILSPDGHCRAFDAEAQGTVGGNGVGFVVLKRLAEALADGDHIYAVIKGAAVNNDGALKLSYLAPSVEGQARVIVEALALAEIPADTITYVEAHGTATLLGDPNEIAALTQAFRSQTDKTGYCAIGSVKTNIGHLDVAAGVTGLIKTALALKHQMIPPSLHFNTPNPHIDFANSPFYVNTQLSEWRTKDLPRRAGVSSFGIGGTNAHLILEESPVPMVPTTHHKTFPVEGENLIRPRAVYLLPLSAKTATALDLATTRILEHLQQHPELNLADVAYTYQVGRGIFNHRRLLLGQTFEEVIKSWAAKDPQKIITHQIQSSESPMMVFMFTGQGAQYVNMGRELYQTETVFRTHLDYGAEFLKPILGIDLRTVLYGGE